MADENKQQLTTFEKLNRILGKTGTDFSQDNQKPTSNNYHIDDEVIARTSSKEEYEKKKREAQQEKYLSQLWQKVDNNIFQYHTQYEATRVAAYSDYENMEFYPEISATLDIMMEEASTPNVNGELLNIYSDSDRVKKILKDLFYNRMDVHTNLPMWIRNTPIREDSMIPLLNGTEVTIKELSDKIKNGEEVWTYAVQDKTHNVVPGKIVWCDLTRENSELVRVTLDDETHIDSTPDHEFILRDGSAKRADELKKNDSLMPFYTRKTNRDNGDLVNDLEKVYDPGSNHYSYTTNICYGAGVKGYRELVLETDQDQSVEIEEMANHKVKSVEFLKETSDVYCMEVRGPNDERDRHNFPVCSKDENGNNLREGAFVANCKYGDNFIYLNVTNSEGVNGVRQLPNFEIERREGDLYNALVNQHGMMSEDGGATNENKQNKNVKFFWKGKDMYFNSWQVAHFRLLSDDRMLPYGVSVLDKARRIWKQLQLCVTKDTKVWTPQGHREIKDINKGDPVYTFDPETSELVETKVKNCWKTGNDREIYKIHTRYSDVEVTDNHPIMVYDGETIQYKNIYEIDKNKDKIFSPTTKDGLGTYEVELDKNDYYIKLNEAGVDHVDLNVEKHGVMGTIKNNIDDQNPKNIHGFLKGNRGIKSNHINSIKETFNIEDEMVDYYVPNQKHNTLADNDLKFKTDEEFLRFFGFMLGDGWLTKRGIGFALGEDEAQNDYYINYVRKAFGKNYTYYEPIEGIRGGVIKVHSKELKNIFEKLGFISGFDKKVIPDWVYSMDRENKLSLIKGLFDADGSYPWKTIGLSNKKLIEQFKDICQQVGIATGKISKKEASIKEEDGRLVNRKATYKLYADLDNIEDLRVENIISIDYMKNDEVWDLEVDHELHNFIANGMVVHNSEDAMLVYRVSRAPERRIYKIYVGNLDDQDVKPFVDQMANNFKRKSMIDPETGQIDLNYNQLAVDQDYFIPVRDENMPSPIETLPGAQNLGEIADIEFLQKKLFTALRVPKSFLGFEEPQGEGKNLALQDIRFSRTINRIQQSIIQELNKVAIIHLYMLGFTDDLDNFTITMNNPSTQAEMLKVEHLQQKLSAYKDAVSDAGNGFGAMSMTQAKKEILGYSEDGIKQDLQEQRMEKAAASELENTSNVIKHTGIYDRVDKVFGDMDKAREGGQEEGEEGDGEDGEGPTAGGGGGMLDQDLDMGAEEELGDEEEGEEGAEGEFGAEEELGGEEGAEEEPGAEEEGEEGAEEEMGESVNKKDPDQRLLEERKQRYLKEVKNKKEKYTERFIDKLAEYQTKGKSDEDLKNRSVKMQGRNLRINENIENMMNEIDDHLDEDVDEEGDNE